MNDGRCWQEVEPNIPMYARFSSGIVPYPNAIHPQSSGRRSPHAVHNEYALTAVTSSHAVRG
jgi:hypothetical protein